MPSRRLALAWSAAALLPALFLPPVARAAQMFPPYPYAAKEFAIIKANGLFHLFYMRRDQLLPEDGAFVDLGHATSPDLEAWTQQPAVIPVRPNNWDNREIWAPHVIERDGVFYLFYSAVTHTPPTHDLHQRIGLAVSNDLYDWTRFDEPVFECSDAPWTYCDPTHPVGGEFRDPFVMPDPATPGDYLMYYVARDDIDRNQYLMGAGRGSGDLMQWTSIGSFPCVDHTKSGSYIIENPTLLAHAGRWYLFYTTWNLHPIQFQSSTDPLGAPATWGPVTSLYAEVNWARTNTWFGPETISDQGHDYFAAVESDAFKIEFWEMVWDANGHFTFAEPTLNVDVHPPAPIVRSSPWKLECGAPAPTWERMEILVGAPHATTARIEVRDVTGRGRRVLLDGALAGGTTRLSWDGNDDRGEPIGSGVYVVTVQSPETRLSRKVVRLR